MRESRSKFSLKTDAVYRHALWHTGLGKKGNIYIAEFPKSGGTWLGQMLGELAGLPFPRNESVKQPCILHGHYLVEKSNTRLVHLMRDGRDVMVSAYHYFLLNEEMSSPVRMYWKNKMHLEDFSDVRSHLPLFINVFFENYRSGWSRKTWTDFVNYYHLRKEVINVKYESLNLDTENTVSSLVDKLELQSSKETQKAIIEKYSFKSQTGRKKGEIGARSFLRKGSVGDWKNYFSRDAADVFNTYAGDALVKAGYERDKNWYD